MANQDLPFWAQNILLPVLNLLAAFLVSALVIWLLGHDPLEALGIMIKGAFASPDGVAYSLGYTLYYATNFIFTGLAVTLAYHAGLFNIGGEGQAMMGGIGLALGVYLVGDIPVMAFIVGVLGAAIFGAAWAFIPAYMQARRGSHVVITTIMFNFIAAAFVSYLLTGPMQSTGSQMAESADFPAAAQLIQWHELSALFGVGVEPSPVNVSLAVALVLAFACWFLLWRTRLGYEMRVVGQNPEAARFAGIPVAHITIIAMALSGAVAGMMGLNELMGEQHRVVLGFTLGYGFVGIAVAFMGRNHPLGVVLAAMLFGALYQGGVELAFEMSGITRDLIIVIQGLVIVFAGALEHLFRDPLIRWLSPPARSGLTGDEGQGAVDSHNKSSGQGEGVR